MTRVATRRGAYRRGGRVANDPSRSATRGRRGVGREGARVPAAVAASRWDRPAVVRVREPEGEAPAEARLGERVVVANEDVPHGHRGGRRRRVPAVRTPRTLVLGQARARAGDSPAERRTGEGKRREDPGTGRRVPATTRSERARSLGKEPETGRRDPAIRARSERGGGRRRRRRGRALPRLSRLRARARPWVWRRARRDRRSDGRWSDGRSLAPRASFIRPRADLRPRSRDFPNDGTGGLDRRRLGSRRERLSPNADQNDARDRSNRTNLPDSSSSSSEGSRAKVRRTRVHH